MAPPAPKQSWEIEMSGSIATLRPEVTLTLLTILVTFSGVFLICFMKGAFGGGFSIVGIPLLSIVMDPVTATAGLASGITTMVAHSGGPPLAMYLLPLGLSKDVYAGTTSLFFTVGNATKAVPWLLLVRPESNVWILTAACLLAIPTGVWMGWRLHGALDQRQIYRVCYGLLVVTAFKLLWDGASGYLA
jgi:uncharacterized membrane protein YfcA